MTCVIKFPQIIITTIANYSFPEENKSLLFSYLLVKLNSTLIIHWCQLPYLQPQVKKNKHA